MQSKGNVDRPMNVASLYLKHLLKEHIYACDPRHCFQDSHVQAGCRQLCVRLVNTCGAQSGRPGLSALHAGLGSRPPRAQPSEVNSEKRRKQRRIAVAFGNDTLIRCGPNNSLQPRKRRAKEYLRSSIGIRLLAQPTMRGFDVAVHNGSRYNGERATASWQPHTIYATRTQPWKGVDATCRAIRVVKCLDV